MSLTDQKSETMMLKHYTTAELVHITHNLIQVSCQQDMI